MLKKIEYLYNAAGQKLQKKVTDGATIKAVDYLDGFQYAGSVLQFFPHPEGYVKATAATPTNTSYYYDYVYNYTDHFDERNQSTALIEVCERSSVRLSYSKDPATNELKIMDETHYYPFGMEHKVYVNPGALDFKTNTDTGNGTKITNVLKTDYLYKYNGKELQDELGLNMYDLGFRNYMPDIGRFTTIDPMADIVNYQSPYVMADNNPVIYEDVYGLGIINAIGNLLKRAFNGIAGAIIPRSMQSCSCNYETKESLGDAFRRPDFPGRGRSSGGGSPNSSSSPSSTPSEGNNKVVSTMDIPEAGLAMNDFSSEISGNINIPDLSSQIPSTTSNGGNLFQEVVNRPTNNRIDMSIDFDNKSTNIRKSPLNEKALNDLVQVLQADPKLRVLILGNVWSNKPAETTDHTAATINGSAGTVGDLKVGRARAIEAFLIERGIDPKRIRVGSGRTGSDKARDISTTFIFK